MERASSQFKAKMRLKQTTAILQIKRSLQLDAQDEALTEPSEVLAQAGELREKAKLTRQQLIVEKLLLASSKTKIAGPFFNGMSVKPEWWTLGLKMAGEVDQQLTEFATVIDDVKYRPPFRTETNLDVIVEKISDTLENKVLKMSRQNSTTMASEEVANSARVRAIILNDACFDLGKISTITGLPTSVIKNMLHLDRTKGFEYVQKKSFDRKGPAARLNDQHLRYLSEVVRFHEGNVTVRELRQTVCDSFGLVVSVPTIWTALTKVLRLSKRKGQSRNRRILQPARDDALEQFLFSLCSVVEQNQILWFIDESGIWLGARDQRRWQPIGQTFMALHDKDDVTKFSLLLAVSANGEFFMEMVEGSVTSVIYSDFVAKLASYVGKRFVLVQDNARIHLSAMAVTTFKKHNILILPPPAYTPEGNLIEMVFAGIKNWLSKSACFSKNDLVYSITLYLSSTWKKNAAKKYLIHSITELRDKIVTNSKSDFN